MIFISFKSTLLSGVKSFHISSHPVISSRGRCGPAPGISQSEPSKERVSYEKATWNQLKSRFYLQWCSSLPSVQCDITTCWVWLQARLVPDICVSRFCRVLSAPVSGVCRVLPARRDARSCRSNATRLKWKLPGLCWADNTVSSPACAAVEFQKWAITETPTSLYWRRRKKENKQSNFRFCAPINSPAILQVFIESCFQEILAAPK